MKFMLTKVGLYGFCFLVLASSLGAKQEGVQIRVEKIEQYRNEALKLDQKRNVVRVGSYVVGTGLLGYLAYKWYKAATLQPEARPVNAPPQVQADIPNQGGHIDPNDREHAGNGQYVRGRNVFNFNWRFLNICSIDLDKRLGGILACVIVGVGRTAIQSAFDVLRLMGLETFYKSQTMSLDEHLFLMYEELMGLLDDMRLWIKKLYNCNSMRVDYSYFKSRALGQRAYIALLLEKFIGYSQAICMQRKDSATYAWITREDSLLFQSFKRLSHDLDTFVKDDASEVAISQSIDAICYALDNCASAVFVKQGVSCVGDCG